MESNKQSLKRGRLTKILAILIILFSLGLVTLAWFAVDSRAQDTHKEESFVSFDGSLDKAHDEIARMQKESQEFVLPKLEVKLPKKEEVKPQVLPQLIIKEEKPKEDPFKRYQALDHKKDEASLYALRLKENRETAFFKALSAKSKVELTTLPSGSVSLGGLSQGTLGSQGSFSSSSDLRSIQQQELQRSLASLQGGSFNGAYQGGAYVSQDKTLDAYQSLDQGANFAISYELQAQTNPYLINQGSVIPAVLLTGINSDLPGLVVAQVIENVYDSRLGNHLLIPQGSKLVGQYGSSPKIGQERVMLGFNRVIFPDGASLALGSMPAASQDGFSGFDADVDNHMLRLLANAVILGGITASITLSQDDDDGDDRDAGSALSEALGVSLGNVLTRVIEQNMNISPTLTVKPGYIFNVVVAKDLQFKGPYQNPFN